MVHLFPLYIYVSVTTATETVKQLINTSFSVNGQDWLLCFFVHVSLKGEMSWDASDCSWELSCRCWYVGKTASRVRRALTSGGSRLLYSAVGL